MSPRIFVFAVCATLAIALPSRAHGPQIQITVDNGQISTRELLIDSPYSVALTSPKSLYVMPLKPSTVPAGTVWYSRPNQALNPSSLQPAFPSGPGLAYGFDLADNSGPQDFAAGSTISVEFTAGLKYWNGAAFIDPGATQLMAFRGSNIAAPTASATTSDSGPFAGVPLAPVEASYGSQGDDIHTGLRFALLGDGTSYTSGVSDGLYLLSLRISNTPAGPAPSDEFYFVLSKHVAWPTAAAAVNSLGIAPSLQQWLIPEPGTIGGLTVFAILLLSYRHRDSSLGIGPC
jgi:hypothetical protein